MGELRSGTHVPRARPTETESDTQGGSKRKHRDKATTIDGEGAHARDNPPGKRRRHQSAGRSEKCPQQLMQHEEGEQADPGLNVKGQRDNDDASDGPDAAEPANTPGEAGEASERATKLPRFSARGSRPKREITKREIPKREIAPKTIYNPVIGRESLKRNGKQKRKQPIDTRRGQRHVPSAHGNHGRP